MKGMIDIDDPDDVSTDNRIASVTSRWNTRAGDIGDFQSSEELRKIPGSSNCRKLFVKPA